MSHILWKSLTENDVDGFRQYLARATYSHGAPKNATTVSSSPALKIGSPGSLGTSPKTPKHKKALTYTNSSTSTRGSGPTLSRADINRRDALGRTLLHHAASLKNGNAMAFVGALLDVPLLDLYIQDLENGWTALHRALYFGNIDVAHALMRKDVQNVTDFASGALLANLGGLVKIKDLEGNSPFEVFGSTVAPRILKDSIPDNLVDGSDDASLMSTDVGDDNADRDRAHHYGHHKTNLEGDEVFAFGSNKNLTLGLGDEDDRQFPERIHLTRPPQLLQRLRDDYFSGRQDSGQHDELVQNASYPNTFGISAVIQNQPILIQDVVMSKMHTAVLTNDPMSNLYVCGFGPGGRLGTGDEATRFNYVCIQGGGIAKRKITSVALGQYHTVAICSTGEVFTWGSNKFGQLGYTLPETSSNTTPMQLTPRQLYGLVKKEQIIGAAASSIHSVIFSANGMYTFGKNEGQLGLVDADARSLDIQIVPRRVGTSILQSSIRSISAIDRATSVLLDNHDVIVFTQYAWKRIIFPLEESPNGTFAQFFSTRYSRQINSICKITSGGNTICALSTYGQVFTLEVPRETEQIASNVSTTNPNKARNALPQPSRVWSIGKPHMSAIDAAVGQDGSIILCTNSGSVWQKEKRAKIKSIHQRASDKGTVKDYKFVRVANLTRSIAVRSNAFGAFTAIRRDADVTREQLQVHPPTFWKDIFPLLAFHDLGKASHNVYQSAEEMQHRFWVSPPKHSSPAFLKSLILSSTDVEDQFVHLSKKFVPLSESPYDVWITSTVTEVRIPVHSFLLKARSRVLRSALAELEKTYYFSIPDILAIEYGPEDCVQIQFQGADFLTLVNIVLFLYADNIVDVWHYTSKALHLAPRYRQVRVELMKIATALELRSLEQATRVMVDPVPGIRQDFESAYQDMDFWAYADVVIDLADGAETPAHSALLCVRCPFFEGLFNGRAGGMWMSSRRAGHDILHEPVRVDLKHIEEHVFHMALRYIYADTDEDIFDDVVTRDLDDFIDLLIDVLSVANELMLDRLAQICQKVLGRYITTRNICGLLNTVAECSVNDFKNAALEYICLNLETMLEAHLLNELDDHLLEELNVVVQENQLSFMPFVRSGRLDADLVTQHPQLLDDIERDQRRRIDYMRLPTRYIQEDERATPKRKLVQNEDELPFTMDEDSGAMSPRLHGERASPSLRPGLGSRRASHLALSTSLELSNSFTSTSVLTDQSSLPISSHQPVVSPPSEANVDTIQSPRAAWKMANLPGLKTDLRSIMEQSTGLRVSNLTQQMAAASIASPKSIAKLSQKERKRQQQEAKKQESVARDDGAKSTTPQSPWTKVTPLPPRSISSPLSNVKTTSASIATATPTRPSMTLRQTISGASDSTKQTQSLSAGKAVSPTIDLSSQPTPPKIQSIRHTPIAVRTSFSIDAHTSMSDILAQQQGEKIAIKEAVAKRSLQEIQQEQEFQAWWDQESRRVQEEEARAQATAIRQSKSNRGGSRGGRKERTGRGGSIANNGTKTTHAKQEINQHESKSTDEVDSTTKKESNNTNHQRSRDRKRGHGTRRGRGNLHGENEHR